MPVPESALELVLELAPELVPELVPATGLELVQASV